MRIYADIYLLENFLSDAVLLFAAGRLAGARISGGRLCLSALCGAFAALMQTKLTALSHPLWQTALFLGMSLVAFGRTALFRKAACLFGTFTLSGGIAFALLIVSPACPEICAMAAGHAAVVVLCLCLSGKIRSVRHRRFAEIELELDGRKFCLRALFDSGNLLCDPISGMPVILCENVFGQSGRRTVCRTPGGETEIGVFFPDAVTVRFDGETFGGKDVAVGAVGGKLCEDGEFQALIGGMCFEQLERKTAGVFSPPVFCGRRVLHRGDGAAAAAPFPGRGGEPVSAVGKRE